MLTFALILSCLPSALIDFALPKWKADPNVRIEDSYKWIYQATRGGEHAVPDKESAKNWLDNEWQGMGEPTANEPVWEPLCPGEEVGRLNLRAFQKRGGKSDDLLEAFLTSSREYKAIVEDFSAAWAELGKRLKKRPAGELNRKEWLKLDTEMKAKNYPAIHHSEQYEKAEHPAYRVLTKGEMQKLLPRLK